MISADLGHPAMSLLPYDYLSEYFVRVLLLKLAKLYRFGISFDAASRGLCQCGHFLHILGN